MLQDWDNFATITGSAAGALTGLLFVAVSLNRDRIVGHAGLRSEARANFSYLSGEDQLYWLLDTVSPNLISTLCIIIAGCLQLAGGDGLYWLAAAVVLTLGGGVINAWLFLTR